MVVPLLLHLGPPVPGTGQPPVDARAGVEEVVGAAAVEGVPEEVQQDVLAAGRPSSSSQHSSGTCQSIAVQTHGAHLACMQCAHNADMCQQHAVNLAVLAGLKPPGKLQQAVLGL